MPRVPEIGDRRFVVAVGGEHGIGVRSERRRLAELGHLAVELGRRRHQDDLAVIVVLDALGVLVGQHLLVVPEPAGLEEHVPLAVLAGQDLLPLRQRALGEQLVEQLHAGRRVDPAVLGCRETLVSEPLQPVDGHAELRPVLVGLQEGEGDEVAVLRAVLVGQWVRCGEMALVGQLVDVEHAGPRDRHAHRPQPDRQQRDIDDDALTGALPFEQGSPDPPGHRHARLQIAEPGPRHRRWELLARGLRTDRRP